MTKLKIGDRVQCQVTEFEGTIVAYMVFLNGSTQCLIVAKTILGMEKKEWWIDTVSLAKTKEKRLVMPDMVTGKNAIVESKKTYGEQKIKMGDKVIDVRTGFKGTMSGYMMSMNGCEDGYIHASITEKGKKGDKLYLSMVALKKDEDEKPAKIKKNAKAQGGLSTTEKRGSC